ncbi:MAG: Rid family detoxifying hydrolase [Beijerinckiaceae bacterium]
MRISIIASLSAVAIVALAAPVSSQQLTKEVINTSKAPAAIGPYSQAIKVGQTVYLAGQIPIDPATNAVRGDMSIEEQTAMVLNHLKSVLEADGMTMANIVATQVFMKDLNEFPRMNTVYATFFPDKPPARATVEVARLPRDVKIEIAATAVKF